MKTWLNGFKLCLPALVTAAWICGCKATDSKAKGTVAVLRMHVEMNQDRSDRTAAVPVYRAHPTMVTVSKSPFLDERYVTEAKVVDDGTGAFSLKIQFEETGAKILEQYSTANRGRRYAVFCQWGDKTMDARWLAAPMFVRTIQDGAIIFTPDATREEAEQIAIGLVNLSKQYRKKGEW